MFSNIKKKKSSFCVLPLKPAKFSFLLGVSSCLILGYFQFHFLAAQMVFFRISTVRRMFSLCSVSLRAVTFTLYLKLHMLDL